MSSNTTNGEFILVVDDNPTNLSVISQALRSVGWQVRIAVDGKDALNKVVQNPPEMILLDVQMPEMDGFEVCRRLKADSTTADIPIIFMTALADSTSKIKGLSLGAVDYITKPIEQEEAIVRIRTHLQLRHLTQKLEQQVWQRTTQLSYALAKLQETQLQIIQSEKMSALGNLVAGVAHEINNPLGCIVGNISEVQNSFKDLLRILELYQQRLPTPDGELVTELEAVDLDYLREDLPKLFQAMQDSSDRIQNISTSLRTFSRADSEDPVASNIHGGIDSTLMILKHRLKANDRRPEILVAKNYGDLPEVVCYAGQLNQVFMNILANAIDAIEESSQGRTYTEAEANPYQITIATKLSPELSSELPPKLPPGLSSESSLKSSPEPQVIIRIADNGKGMTEEVKQKIFEHLFTTKGIGKGTGLGLAIVRQIVVDKHGGTIRVNSTPGVGTEFILTLPANCSGG